jgi:hypothetical protein
MVPAVRMLYHGVPFCDKPFLYIDYEAFVKICRFFWQLLSQPHRPMLSPFKADVANGQKWYFGGKPVSIA